MLNNVKVDISAHEEALEPLGSFLWEALAHLSMTYDFSYISSSNQDGHVCFQRIHRLQSIHERPIPAGILLKQISLKTAKKQLWTRWRSKSKTSAKNLLNCWLDEVSPAIMTPWGSLTLVTLLWWASHKHKFQVSLLSGGPKSES